MKNRKTLLSEGGKDLRSKAHRSESASSRTASRSTLKWNAKGVSTAGPDRPPTARTCPIDEFWLNFAYYGSRIGALKKFLNDSAWFLLEKLKKHVISTKNFNI